MFFQASPAASDAVMLPTRFRTLFISDLHLGSRGCQAELFLDFLRHHDADTIYLVGDIIDGWRLKARWYWPPSHNTVVQKILGISRHGTRVVYIPGNHDDFARHYVGRTVGGIKVLRSAIHVMADGRRFHVTHGDEYDIVVKKARWLAFVGGWAYEVALRVNVQLNRVRRRLGLPYWSFSAWAKLKVKQAVNFIRSFEEALSDHAARHAYDGVVCGHIHHAAMRDLNGVTYVNTGDFVESCTVAAEHFDGTLQILSWKRPGAQVEAATAHILNGIEPEYA